MWRLTVSARTSSRDVSTADFVRFLGVSSEEDSVDDLGEIGSRLLEDLVMRTTGRRPEKRFEHMKVDFGPVVCPPEEKIEHESTRTNPQVQADDFIFIRTKTRSQAQHWSREQMK